MIKLISSGEDWFLLNSPGKLSLKEKWGPNELTHMHLQRWVSTTPELTKHLYFLSPTSLVPYSVGVTSPTYSSKSHDFSAHLWIIKCCDDVKSESKFRNENALSKLFSLAHVCFKLSPALGKGSLLIAPPPGSLLLSSSTLDCSLDFSWGREESYGRGNLVLF